MLNRKLKPITYPFLSNNGNYIMNLFGVDVLYQKYKLLTIVQKSVFNINLDNSACMMYEMGL